MDQGKLERLYAKGVVLLSPPHLGRTELLAHRVAIAMEKHEAIISNELDLAGIAEILAKSKYGAKYATFLIKPVPEVNPVLAAVLKETEKSKAHKFNPSPPSDFYYNQHKRGKKNRHNRGKFI